MCAFLELLCSQNVVEKDFVHVTYTDAVALLQKAKKKFEFPVSTPHCHPSFTSFFLHSENRQTWQGNVEHYNDSWRIRQIGVVWSNLISYSVTRLGNFIFTYSMNVFKLLWRQGAEVLVGGTCRWNGGVTCRVSMSAISQRRLLVATQLLLPTIQRWVFQEGKQLVASIYIYIYSRFGSPNRIVLFSCTKKYV